MTFLVEVSAFALHKKNYIMYTITCLSACVSVPVVANSFCFKYLANENDMQHLLFLSTGASMLLSEKLNCFFFPDKKEA